MKKIYGREYPAAVVIKGSRLPLICETRFTRYYHSKTHNMGTEVSRFMDGSASITLAELKRDWPSLTETERLCFCNASCWLYQQEDFSDMLRFVFRVGKQDQWAPVAGNVATYLPREEAFKLLVHSHPTGN